jgi:glycosyltransferase involved in cell wall biosynthesis
MNKLVSVIITTYNRLDLLKKTLNSVKKQSYENIEILIIDSSDNQNTQKYISQYNDIIYAHSTINHPNILRNLGIQCSNGELIAFLDDDDTWHEDKINRQVECFNKNNIALCYTGKNIVIETENSNKIKYSFKKGRFNSDKKSIFWDNFIGITSSIMIKKDIINQIGDFDESLPALQDYDFVIRVCQKFNVKGINLPLVNYSYNHNKTQVSKDYIKFLQACNIIKNKYHDSNLLKFGLWKLKIKRWIKKYE